MTNDHGNSIKDEDTYEALRDKGYSKPKAAAIANAQANDQMSPARRGGMSPAYEEWTKAKLMERARELDIDGRSKMSKDALIDALRS